jgi:hypothetical protein
VYKGSECPETSEEIKKELAADTDNLREAPVKGSECYDWGKDWD